MRGCDDFEVGGEVVLLIKIIKILRLFVMIGELLIAPNVSGCDQ